MAKMGSGQITLVDLTDQRPIRVDLATSLSVIQIQTGDIYTPDYTGENGQIITPSIFFGQEEVATTKYFDKIKYNCSDEGDEVDYSYIKDFVPADNPTKSYVDNFGRFHLRRNLTKNITIEINLITGANIIDEATGVTYDSIYEKIDLQIVNQENGYSNFIISEDGRYDFEDEHRDDVKLISKVYSGASEVSFDEIASWTWYRSENGTIPIKTSNVENFYILQREQVFGHETFICETRLNNGMIFRAQVKIDDRTDIYSSIIQANGSTILTPLLNQVSLECQIWRGTEEFNSSNIIYDWYYIKNNEIYQFSGDNNKQITIVLDDKRDGENNLIVDTTGFHLPKESLTIYCKTTIIENSKIVSKPISYIALQYTSTYSVNVNPDTIFIPVNSDGTFRGTNFSKDITFSLIGEDGQPLFYESATSEINIPIITGAPAIHFERKNSENETVWEKTFTLTIDTQKSLGNWDSNIATINYRYLGVQFVKTFDIIKNVQGADGINGASGQSAYTIDLTNSSHRFAGEERWAFLDQSINFGYTARLGDERLIIKQIIVQSTNSTTGTVLTSSSKVEVVKGLYITYNQGTSDSEEKKAFILSTDNSGIQNPHYLEEESGTFWIDIQVQYGSWKPVTFRKMFNYGFTKTGNSYTLTASPNALVYSPSSNSYDVSNIVITTQYQQRGAGPLLPYMNSKVLYSINGKDFILLKENNLSLQLLPMGTTSITFRMYFDSDDENSNILDEETVPIVTSLDGAVIGGENLLKWTKDMPIANNKWIISSNNFISKKFEEGFASLNFNVGIGQPNWIAWSASPKSEFLQEYLGEKFCLSFYIKINDWIENDTKDNRISFSLCLNENYNTLIRERFGTIFALSENKIFSENCNIKDSIPRNEWVYVYSTFTIPKTDAEDNKFNRTDSKNEDGTEASPLSLSKCKYLSIRAILFNAANIEIKKIKLEKGSAPTDWSPAYTDNVSLDVSGANIFVNQLITSLDDSNNKTISTELDENGTYTISYQDINSLSSDIIMTINDPGIPNKIISLPINTNYEYSFDINGVSDNNNAIITIIAAERAGISYLKLEKGEYSGSWAYTSENIRQFIDDVTFYYEPDQVSSIQMPIQGINGNITYDNKRLQTYKITTPDGKEITFISKEDFANYIKDIYENNLRAQQTWTSTQIAADVNPLSTQIKEIRNSIEINANAAEPYIEIKTTADKSSIYLRLTPDELAFMENDNKLAYFKSSRLYVPHAQITNYLDFGNINANSFLRLKVTSDSGVGFIWVNG